MAPSIPDRWKDYSPVGQKIEGTRFVAFKVPLREQVSNNVAHNIRLDGNILLKSIPELGLIIDLTNTKRYYDPNFFKNAGVEYFKLMIPGREVPPRQLIDKFNDLVKKFLAHNSKNDKLIGVHCTHGVNRTGFLICNYMISEMRVDPNEAISKFAKARGHNIERTNYINALQAQLTTTRDTKTVREQSPKISNWRDRQDQLAEPNHLRNRDELPSHWRDRQQHVPAKLNNWRQRAVAARSEPVNWRDRNDAHNRDRSRRRRSRSRSPNNNRVNDNNFQQQSRHHRDERSTHSYRSVREPQETVIRQKQSRLHADERPTHSYRYVREPQETVIHQKPPLRIDYYNARPKSREGQRSINLQRYKYHRNTHNS